MRPRVAGVAEKVVSTLQECNEITVILLYVYILSIVMSLNRLNEARRVGEKDLVHEPTTTINHHHCSSTWNKAISDVCARTRWHVLWRGGGGGGGGEGVTGKRVVCIEDKAVRTSQELVAAVHCVCFLNNHACMQYD